jgi:hypothetical protein
MSSNQGETINLFNQRRWALAFGALVVQKASRDVSRTEVVKRGRRIAAVVAAGLVAL